MQDKSKADRTWSISELAGEFDVTPRALRFYEDRGLLSPTRDGLSRRYSARDRARLQLILRGKRLGFPLSEIRAMLDLYHYGGERAQMLAALKTFRERLVALEQQRADVQHAIVELQGHIATIEERLAGPAPGEEIARAFAEVAQKRLRDV